MWFNEWFEYEPYLEAFQPALIVDTVALPKKDAMVPQNQLTDASFLNIIDKYNQNWKHVAGFRTNMQISIKFCTFCLIPQPIVRPMNRETGEQGIDSLDGRRPR